MVQTVGVTVSYKKEHALIYFLLRLTRVFDFLQDTLSYILVPRFSLLPVERPCWVWSGVRQNLGDYKQTKFGGGEDKCEICLCRAYMESAAVKLCT